MPPQSGHGALYAVEVDPVGAPGVYSTVPELNGDITTGATRNAIEAPIHNSNSLRRFPSNMIDFGEWAISFNYVYGDPIHAAMRTHWLTGTIFGARKRGPGGLANSDEMLASGFISNWQESNPVGTDSLRTVEATFSISSSVIVDGVTYGA